MPIERYIRHLTWMVLVMLLLIGLPPLLAMADDLTWNWSDPITRADCTTLNSADLAGYHIMINGAAETEPDGTLTLFPPGTNTLTKAVPAGEVCLQIQTVDVDGRLSDWSPDHNIDPFTDACGGVGKIIACKSVTAPPGEINTLTLTVTVD